MKNYYIYRYHNKENEVIYVGLTARPIRQRVKEHESEELQKETDYIEYAEVKSAADMRMYELFYINKHNPKFNKRDIYKDGISLDLPELNFIPFLHKGENASCKIKGSEDKRIYKIKMKTGIIDVTVENPYSRNSQERKISIATKGEITCTVNEFREFLENCVQAFNDVLDDDFVELIQSEA